MSDRTKEAMDLIIKKIEPIVRENKDKALVMGALVFWVVELIKKGSTSPGKTTASICELIKEGVEKDA
jgi:hypothetical protein